MAAMTLVLILVASVGALELWLFCRLGARPNADDATAGTPKWPADPAAPLEPRITRRAPPSGRGPRARRALRPRQ
jgi:hypothetical protein